MLFKKSNIWSDAFILAESFRLTRKTNPYRWQEILQECKQSRRFRKWWLKKVRNDFWFKLYYAVYC